MGWLACAAYSPGYAREHCLSSSAVPILEMRGARGFPCSQPEIARRRTHVRDSNSYRRRGHDDRQRRSPMKLPVQITARHMSLSEAAEAAIREKAEKLDTFYDRNMSCRVLVEAHHRSQQNGQKQICDDTLLLLRGAVPLRGSSPRRAACAHVSGAGAARQGHPHLSR